MQNPNSYPIEEVDVKVSDEPLVLLVVLGTVIFVVPDCEQLYILKAKTRRVSRDRGKRTSRP